MKQKKQVRLSDIAEKLNISTVTVSKALSGKDGVGDDLREQIKELATQMGYKFKSTATITGGSTGNIGIVIPARYFSPDASFYWYIFNHLSKALLDKGWYSIMELISDEDEAALTPPRLITDKKTDGIIFLGQLAEAYIKKIATTYSNFVLMDYYIADPDIDCIVNDDYYNSYLITSYLISRGHKKIQFVGKFNATTSIRDRYMGFEKAMHENELPCSFDKIIDDRNTPAELIKMKLPSRDHMPTAFVCNCDLIASRLIHQLNDEGYKVPEDISVTGYDNFLSEEEKTVPLTTIGVEPQTLCSMAADLIINKITGKPYVKGRHLATGKIIIRDSVKRV
jgi:LacI family transcriptional regulator